MDDLAYRHYHMYARINLHQVPRRDSGHWAFTRCAIDNKIPLDQLVPEPLILEKLQFGPCRRDNPYHSASDDCSCDIARRRLVYNLFQKALGQNYILTHLYYCWFFT